MLGVGHGGSGGCDTFLTHPSVHSLFATSYRRGGRIRRPTGVNLMTQLESADKEAVSGQSLCTIFDLNSFCPACKESAQRDRLRFTRLGIMFNGNSRGLEGIIAQRRVLGSRLTLLSRFSCF
jgi:hypothetical protein